MANRSKATAKKREMIQCSLRAGDSLGTAAARAGIHRNTLHEWRRDDPAFADACEEAIEHGTDILEDVARARAVQQSDRLMIFLLKARRPEKYRETNRSEVNVNLTVVLQELAERVAAEEGLDASEVIAEAEKFLAESR